MAKKRPEEHDLPTPEDQQKQIAEAVTTTPLLYTLGQWRGMTTWQCAFCPWDTLEGESAFYEHYRSQHAQPAEPDEPPPPTIPVADRWGNEIKS
jgi:hypothetical protein